MYTWDGRWVEEDDYDPPTLRRHCTGCGAFLPKTHSMRERMVPTDWQYMYDDDNECTGVVILKEEKEMDAVWTCTRCKREFSDDEMYQ